MLDKRIEVYELKKTNILENRLNCIPIPFPKLSKFFPGFEKGKYILLSANQKAGKTKLALFMSVLYPLWLAYNRKDFGLHIIYFSLEMSKDELYDQMVCWYVYIITEGRIEISTMELNSVDKNHMLNTEVLEIIKSEKFKSFFSFIDEHLDINSSDSNPYGMYKYCVEYANAHGRTVMRRLERKVIDEVTNLPKMEVSNIPDYYIPDTDEYRFVVLDHFSLITPEKGMDLRASMKKFSSRDILRLKSFYGFTFINIQQQANAQESLENIKSNMSRPSVAGLETYKDSGKDCDVMLGLYDPNRHGISTYANYNIREFGDKIRFLEVVLNRNGGALGTSALLFKGAVNHFKELPRYDDPELKTIIRNLGR